MKYDPRLTGYHLRKASPTAETDRLSVVPPSLLKRDAQEAQWLVDQRAQAAAKCMVIALRMVEPVLAAHSNCPAKNGAPCQHCRALLIVRAAIAQATEQI